MYELACLTLTFHTAFQSLTTQLTRPTRRNAVSVHFVRASVGRGCLERFATLQRRLATAWALRGAAALLGLSMLLRSLGFGAGAGGAGGLLLRSANVPSLRFVTCRAELAYGVLVLFFKICLLGVGAALLLKLLS